MKTKLLAAFTLLSVVTLHAAKDEKPPEVDSPAKVKPGTTGLLKAAGKGMRTQ